MANPSKPIEAKARKATAKRSEDELVGDRPPFSSSVRFDHVSPARGDNSRDDDFDQHYASSYYEPERRVSSFGFNASGFGFPGPSTSMTLSNRHGHGFPERAASVRDISVLANLVDYRSNYYEENRVSEEEIKQRTRHLGWSKASAVHEYYERLNETLDGWREVDEILDSKFPDEVMRRFADEDGSDKKKRRTNRKHKSKPKKRPQVQQRLSDQESDGNVSDEEETEGEERGRKRPFKRSFSAKAMNAFSGLWGGGSNSPARADLERGVRSSSRSREDAVNGVHEPLLKKKPSLSQPHQTFDLISTAEEDEEDEADAAAEEAEPNGNDPAVGSSSPRVGEQRLKRRDYGATSNASSAGQLYERLRREGRIEQIRRSESNLTLSSAAGTPGTQSPRDGTSTPESKAHTIRTARQIENIPEYAARQDPTGAEEAQTFPNIKDKIIERSSQPGSLDRKYTRDRSERPYASMQEDREALLSVVPGRAKEEEASRSVQFAININLLVNILLLAGKGFAVLSSNSVSLIASLVDSALDLVSTVIIFGTSKAIAYRSWKTMYKYPVGKKRLEPLGVVIFSVLMIASFVQVFIESVSRLRIVLATGEQDPEAAADLPLIGIAFMLATVGIKTVMWLLYRSSKSSGVRAVAQDAENDVVFNIASLIFPIVGSRLGWPALDPIGGIVLSVYIIYEWVETLWETVTKLSGAVASATEISKCLYCITRFNSVRSVSAFELFHSGDDLIVEADIVLPHSISLKESHDLGEIITYCTENITSVERSYIHLDYNPKGQAGHLGQRG